MNNQEEIIDFLLAEKVNELRMGLYDSYGSIETWSRLRAQIIEKFGVDFYEADDVCYITMLKKFC